MNEPRISIIVPVHNAEKTLKKCIESLLCLDYSNYEVAIVDDGSVDKTFAILGEYRDRITIIRSHHAGPSKARNDAAKIAQGDFLAFTDADCIVDKNWLNELLKGFENESIAAAGGSQYSPEEETAFGKRVQLFFELTGFLGGYIKGRDQDAIVEVAHNPSCNVMYRKSAFVGIGGFDEGLWPSEDVDLDYRLKKKKFNFRYNPRAVVYHYRPQSLKALSQMMYRYGVMQGVLTKRYGFFRRIQFIPVVFVLFALLVFVNPAWLICLLPLYCFFMIKSKSFIEGNSVVWLCIVSAFAWMGGFIIGIARQ